MSTKPTNQSVVEKLLALAFKEDHPDGRGVTTPKSYALLQHIRDVVNSGELFDYLDSLIKKQK